MNNLRCPQCGLSHIKRNGYTHYGKQNYRCKVCDRQFVEDSQHIGEEVTYSLFDHTEDPNKRLNYFRKHGVIRSLPLVPPPNPAASIRKALDALSSDGTGPDGPPGYDMLFNQALWLLDSVYEVEDATLWDKMFSATVGDREKAAEAISRLKLRWDGKKQDYTFANGTTPRMTAPAATCEIFRNPMSPNLTLH
jgi:hypothetical protein